MIEWLSSNAWVVIPASASAISAVAAVCAVATSLYVYHASKRPDVIAHVEPDYDKGYVHLIVENVGNGTARDIALVDLKVSDICPERYAVMVSKSFVVRGIPTLAPGSKRDTVVCTVAHAGDKLRDYESEVKLVYKRKTPYMGRWKFVEDTFILDFYSISGALKTESDMHSIKNSMKTIAKNTAK